MIPYNYLYAYKRIQVSVEASKAFDEFLRI
jgi:hypothetical protein